MGFNSGFKGLNSVPCFVAQYKQIWIDQLSSHMMEHSNGELHTLLPRPSHRLVFKKYILLNENLRISSDPKSWWYSGSSRQVSWSLISLSLVCKALLDHFAFSARSTCLCSSNDLLFFVISLQFFYTHVLQHGLRFAWFSLVQTNATTTHCSSCQRDFTHVAWAPNGVVK